MLSHGADLPSFFAALGAIVSRVGCKRRSTCQDRPGIQTWKESRGKRVVCIRLIHHKPRFAILDECSSAITSEMEQRLYKICDEWDITYITIAHRPVLRAYHDLSLAIGDGKQGWKLEKIDGAKERMRCARTHLHTKTNTYTSFCVQFSSVEPDQFTKTGFGQTQATLHKANGFRCVPTASGQRSWRRRQLCRRT